MYLGKSAAKLKPGDFRVPQDAVEKPEFSVSGKARGFSKARTSTTNYEPL